MPTPSRNLFSAGQLLQMPLSLSHGVGPDRHLMVRCRCGRFEEFDAGPLLRKGLGGQRIADVRERLVCSCGLRGADLEIWSGAPGFDVPERYLRR